MCVVTASFKVASAQTVPPDTSRAVIDSVYAIIQEQSLFRDRVDWTETDKTFRSAVDAAGTFAEALDAFRLVFEALDDVHSAIYYAGTGIAYRRPPSRPVVRDVRSLIMLSRERANQPEGRMLPGGVGYVYVPAYGPIGPDPINEGARALRDVVCDLAAEAGNGWIVDLRVNEGGNIHPMLSGLGDLLGDGVVARSVGSSGEAQFGWSIVDGVLSIDGYSAATVERRCPEARELGPIAVLIGPATLSSGQITAVAFAGWERARLFGDPTAEGYATNNAWHQITPALALNLSTAYFADRSGYVHEGIVLPDEQVEGEWRLDDLENDPVVQRALAWIAQD